MLGPYRELLATPGAKAFAVACLVMRTPMSMIGLGIVLLVSSTTGSYGLAGAVSATYALVHAAVQPQLGRLADRRGQVRVAVPAGIVHGLGIAVLVGSAVWDGPTWGLFIGAAVAGAAFLPVGSFVRARWSNALGDAAGGRSPDEAPLLGTAYALESTLDELVYIVGPVLVTLLATRVAPAAGLLAGLAFVAVGTAALAPQRRTEPPRGHDADTRSGSALRVAGVRVLVAVFVGVGAIFGTIEVTVVAFADERGVPAAAAVVLALFAGGSMLAGLCYGAVPWRIPLDRRFRGAVSALAVAAALLPLAGAVPVLAVLAFVGGFAISPTLIAGYGLIEALAPPGARTEALTWISSGVGVGLAAGASLSGWAIDTAGARQAFLVALVAGLAAAATAAIGARRLRPSLPAEADLVHA